MKQEFITTKGKIIRERDILFIKTLSHGCAIGLLRHSFPRILYRRNLPDALDDMNSY